MWHPPSTSWCYYPFYVHNVATNPLEDLRHLAALSALVTTVPPEQRPLIEPIITDLQARIGPSVPKRRAAALLDISVQALDLWIKQGRIETQRAPGAHRTAIDTAGLIWTANQIPPGTTRPGRLVDRARARERQRAEFWRFNEHVARRDIRETRCLPLLERVQQIDQLNGGLALISEVARANPQADEDVEERRAVTRHTPLAVEQLLMGLATREVDFVITGGIAVGLHGYVRATNDLDIMVASEPDNIERLWKFLGDVEAEPLALDGFDPQETPVPFTPTTIINGQGNWLLNTRFGRLDVMQWVAGVDSYTGLRARAEVEGLGTTGMIIRYATLADVYTMKAAAGQSQDLVDIERLRAGIENPDGV